MKYQLQNYTPLAFFSFFLKKRFYDLYEPFREYILTHKLLTRYWDKQENLYFSHVYSFIDFCHSFKRIKTPNSSIIVTEWYTFLYSSTNLNEDMKKSIRHLCKPNIRK